MSINAAAQIQAILSRLTPEQRAKVENAIDLKNVNIMTLSESEALALLAKLNVAVGLATNPIKSGVDEYQAKLDRAKAKDTAIWEEARTAYYVQANIASLDGSLESKKKADDLFFEMQLAGEHMLASTKRANNSAIQNILFNA